MTLFMVRLRSAAGMSLPPEPASASPLSSDAACERSRRAVLHMPGHPTARLRRVRGQDALAPRPPPEANCQSINVSRGLFHASLQPRTPGRRRAGNKDRLPDIGRASGGKAFCLPSRRQARWLLLRRKWRLAAPGKAECLPSRRRPFPRRINALRNLFPCEEPDLQGIDHADAYR